MERKTPKNPARKPFKAIVAPKKIVKRLRKISLGKSQASKQAIALIGLHNLKPARGAHTPKRILGRGPGSGHGKTSSRGSKGQTSRSGRDVYPGFEGGQSPLIRRIAKRGFSGAYNPDYQIVSLGKLSKLKEKIITPGLMEDKGLVKDKSKRIKILGDGEVKERLTISAHAFSKSAEEKIKNAGGRIEVLNV